MTQYQDRIDALNVLIDNKKTRLEKQFADMESTLATLQSQQSAEFYLSIDTQRKKLQFRLGPTVVREADVQIGEAKTITSPLKKKWTFRQLKGGFTVIGKEEGYAWPVPEWVYAMRGQTTPADRAA